MNANGNTYIYYVLFVSLPEIAQSYCCLYHPLQFCWLTQEIESLYLKTFYLSFIIKQIFLLYKTHHLVTFYEIPLFEWSSFPICVGPLTEFLVFVHHWMTLDYIRFHRMGCSQILWEMIQQHHSNMLPVLLHYLGSYSVFENI